MKVVHLISTIELGGAEKQLLTLISEQIRLGLVVEVIYLKGNPTLEVQLESLGAQINHIAANKKIVTQLLLLKLYFRKQNFIIHAHLPQAEIIASLTCSGNNFVITRHTSSLLVVKWGATISRLIARFTSRRADCVIAISNAAKTFLLTSKEISPKTPIHVVHYALSTKAIKSEKYDLIQLKRSLGVSESDFILGTIARLSPEKDYPTLLNAFKLFLERKNNSVLLIIGVGTFETAYKKLAADLGISTKIIWLGAREDVDMIFEILDIFVLASKTEGFGLVLLEAINSSVSIVASNNSAIPEVLGMDYPYLVKTGSPEAFCKAFVDLSLSHNANLAKDLLRGRRAEFIPSKMGQAVIDIYSELIAVKKVRVFSLNKKNLMCEIDKGKGAL